MALLSSACGGTATQTQEPTLESVEAAVDDFFSYMKFRQWDEMWPMLHPDMQAVYGSLDEFSEYMDMSPYLKDWTIGAPGVAPEWTCKSTEQLAGTNQTYHDVAEIPVTFVYTTAWGETEYSETTYAVAVGNEWRFFFRKIIG